MGTLFKRENILVFISLTIFALGLSLQTQGYGNSVLIVNVNGDLNYATEVMIDDALKFASGMGTRLIVVELNTPGGQIDSVKNIMVKFDSSKIPICVFVYPIGATAWSGGTYVLMASHIAAMAPGSIIGSCQPVEYFTSTPISYSKYINALTELMVSHARLHCRNETLAMKFVAENLNLEAAGACRGRVVEFMASNIEELLKQLENYDLVKFSRNGEVFWKLVGKGVEVEGLIQRLSFEEIGQARIMKYSGGIQYQVLSLLVNPFLCSLMLVIGVFSVLIGIKTPGYGAELAGSILILLSLIGYGVIGVNLAGIVLVVFGFSLIVAEIKTHIGILIPLGIICILIGGFLIFPSPSWLIYVENIEALRRTFILISTVSAIFFSFIAYKAAETRKLKIKSGIEALIGEVGEVVSDLKPEGYVRLAGEVWRARIKKGEASKGSKVKVVGWRGIKLIVEKKEKN